MAVAADVPGTFDVVIDGKGYIFADVQEIKAEFGMTPTFVERQNVQGDYGDNQQDFWLTATQRDWSLGEQQRYFRSSDDASVRRFWQGDAIDVTSMPGQVSLRQALTSPSITTPLVCCGGKGGATVYVATSTNLFTVDSAGAVVDKGAHGLGVAPTAITNDHQNVYLSSTGPGTVGVRKWNGTAFSTFSASGADELCYLNNALYGVRLGASQGDLVRWDSAGALTSLFTWKDSDGTIQLSSASAVRLAAFGGQLLIAKAYGGSNGDACDLWLYNGTAPAKVAEFNSNFLLHELLVVQGVAFISGQLRSLDSRPAILFYDNGTDGLLWKASAAADGTSFCGMGAYEDGFVFNDTSQGKLMFYSPAYGGIHPVAAFAPNPARCYFASGFGFVLGLASGVSFVRVLGPSASSISTGSVITSLFDLDSSLEKRFHAVKLDFEAATDGNGGTVDVAYRIDDLNGAFTSLATNVGPGVEIALGVNAHAIAIKVTLNKGTSTSGPVLKRISLRASPVQPQFPRATYMLDCTGSTRDPKSRVQLRNGNRDSRTGLQMVKDLKSSAGKAAPMSITDQLNGTFSGVVETDSLKAQAVRRSDEFVVQLSVRGV